MSQNPYHFTVKIPTLQEETGKDKNKNQTTMKKGQLTVEQCSNNRLVSKVILHEFIF
jgi:hypothetical protein